jgi:hypothetical protein
MSFVKTLAATPRTAFTLDGTPLFQRMALTVSDCTELGGKIGSWVLWVQISDINVDVRNRIRHLEAI